MIRQEEVYKIGKIGKPHGVNGELSFMFDDDVFDRVDAEYLILQIDGILVPFFMDEYRFKSGETALVKFSGIDTKERASQLTGSEVFFPRAMSDSTDGDLSWAEIIGFSIVDVDIYNKVIGTIVSVDESTVNILFEVRTDDGDIILIPAAPEFITGVDANAKQITVELPEGLLDLDN